MKPPFSYGFPMVCLPEGNLSSIRPKKKGRKESLGVAVLKPHNSRLWLFPVFCAAVPAKQIQENQSCPLGCGHLGSRKTPWTIKTYVKQNYICRKTIPKKAYLQMFSLHVPFMFPNNLEEFPLFLGAQFPSSFPYLGHHVHPFGFVHRAISVSVWGLVSGLGWNL